LGSGALGNYAFELMLSTVRLQFLIPPNCTQKAAPPNAGFELPSRYLFIVDDHLLTYLLHAYRREEFGLNFDVRIVERSVRP
jgi:hypothetical protein